MIARWSVETMAFDAFLVDPQGLRLARMPRAKAFAIAAALNTNEGYEAYHKTYNLHNGFWDEYEEDA